MAQPASKLPEEDKPDFRPELLKERERMGGSNTSAGGRVNWTRGNDGGATTSTRASDGGATTSTAASDGGATTGTGGKKGFYKPDDLKNGEESPSESDGEWWNPGNSNQTGRRRFRTKITKQKVALSGALLGGGVAGIIGFVSVVQGPMEFVHIAQLLDRFHFLSQQDAEDGRLMKVVRYIHDPSKPQNTRMGLVGNAIANRLESNIAKETGLRPKYNKTSGRFEGWTVDKSQGPFKDMANDQERIKSIVNDYGEFGISERNITRDLGTGEILIKPDSGGVNTVRTYRNDTGFAKATLTKAGYSKKMAYAGSRILGTRAGWTFHPIKALDAAIQAKLLEGGKAAVDAAKKQFRKDQVQYTEKGAPVVEVSTRENPKEGTDGKPDPAAAQGAQDVNSNADDLEKAAKDAGTQIVDGEDGAKALSDKISVKAAGGAAGLAGVLCLAKGVNQEVKAAKFDKAILPMMRMAGQMMSLGSQVQAGQDITTVQLGFFKDLLDQKDANGKVTSTWNQAESIEAELGQPLSGKDIPEAGRVFNGSPLDFVDHISGLKTVCDIMSSPVGIVVGVLTGPVSFVAGSFASGEASHLLAGWLSGSPVNPLAAGADFGNFINYGARLSANDAFAAVGGVFMDASSEIAIQQADNSVDQQEFQSQSLADRVFNINDSRSLASNLMDRYGSSGPAQDVASLATGFGSIFSSALKIPGTLITGVGHAATPKNYDYHGLKAVGFTTQELTDVNTENPFDNACHVVGCPDKNVTGILEDSNAASNYEDLAQKCFGVKISNDGGTWNIDSKDAKAVNLYDDSYPAAKCADTSDPNWLRIRMWILDTATIEGYDCYQGGSDTSDQSCEDVGFGNTAATSDTGSSDSTTQDASKIEQGSRADLAKKLLDYKKTGQYNCDNAGDCTDLQKVIDGKSLAGSQGCQAQTLDPRVLQLMLYQIEVGNFKIGTFALCGDHGFDSSRGHSGGFAVDISSVDGQAINKDDPKTKAAALKMDKFLNNLPAPLQLSQQISWGYGEHYDKDLADTQQYGGKLCHSSCSGIYTITVEQEHMNHIHAGF